MFNVGDRVLYTSNGVCEIIEITRKVIGGKDMEYYVLKPICSQVSTLFVPTQNEELVGKMRYILSPDELRDILNCKSDEDNSWNDNKNERYVECRDIISGGDCRSLVRMIRCFYAHSRLQASKGRRLHISDERLLKEAEKMICDEFSVVLNIDRAEVIPLILK